MTKDKDYPAPDPNDPDALALAAALTSRSQLVRIAPGEVVTVQPRRFHRYAVAYSVNRLTAEQRDWLVAFKKAADAKRRADREASRQARRARG